MASYHLPAPPPRPYGWPTQPILNPLKPSSQPGTYGEPKSPHSACTGRRNGALDIPNALARPVPAPVGRPSGPMGRQSTLSRQRKKRTFERAALTVDPCVAFLLSPPPLLPFGRLDLCFDPIEAFVLRFWIGAKPRIRLPPPHDSIARLVEHERPAHAPARPTGWRQGACLWRRSPSIPPDAPPPNRDADRTP